MDKVGNLPLVEINEPSNVIALFFFFLVTGYPETVKVLNSIYNTKEDSLNF